MPEIPAMTKALDRRFTEKSGLSVFPIKNARHGLISGMIPKISGPSSSRDTLAAVRAEIEQLASLDSIVALTLFVAEAESIQVWLDRVAEVFPANALPSLTCVAQPSCEPNLIGFEAYLVEGNNVSIDRRVSCNSVMVRHDGLNWLHCGQVVSPEQADVYVGSSAMFHKAHEVLARSGCHFNRVIRTWLYQGNIVGHEGQTVRYHELNRARTDFFEADAQVAAPYPASTGIGQEGTEVTMSCVALTSDDNNTFYNVALENPCQTSAFDYEKKYSAKSPKFSRAMATVLDGQAIIWVSGTASITDSETRHPGDVAAQTHQTLENIRELISTENLARHDVDGHDIDGLGADLGDLASARVYIKHRADYQVVRSICEKLLGRTPAIYVEADICRDDLLVEIEAIAYCG